MSWSGYFAYVLRHCESALEALGNGGEAVEVHLTVIFVREILRIG